MKKVVIASILILGVGLIAHAQTTTADSNVIALVNAQIDSHKNPLAKVDLFFRPGMLQTDKVYPDNALILLGYRNSLPVGQHLTYYGKDYVVKGYYPIIVPANEVHAVAVRRHPGKVVTVTGPTIIKPGVQPQIIKVQPAK